MQYCPNCRVQIRGRKSRCPLCQRELTDLGGQADDPFVKLPSPRVSFRRMIQIVTFVCISLEILLGAFEIIRGFTAGWIYGFMVIILLAGVDFQVAVYYRNNLIRMLTVQGYIIMAALLIIAHLTKSGSWAVSWVVPSMFLMLIIVTFAAAKFQQMELQEFILYPAFDVLMSLLQIIPIISGYNKTIAPAVFSIALMLILVSSLVIFRGDMLRDAAAKYLHM